MPTFSNVQSLAPDAASYSAGCKTAKASWASSGRSSRALWGEFCGSGKTPYRVQVDLATQGYSCSCPSRKFPCKHVLGLMILESESKLEEAPEPEWVVERLAKRAEREAKKAAKANEPVAPDDVKKRAVAKKTEDKRAGRVAEGLGELKTFLCDLLRAGIANLGADSSALFEERSKRMIDAQAPGVASMLGDCAAIVGVGADWRKVLLRKLGQIATLIEAYSKVDKAPEDFASEIRQTVGRTVPQKDVLSSGERVEDRWFYLGATTSLNGRVLTKRTWLIGEQTERVACRLDFAVGRQASFPVSLDSQVPMKGALRFFPGASKLRAIWEEAAPPVPCPTPRLPLSELAASIPEFFENLRVRLAANPWQDRFPALLRDVVVRPRQAEDAPETERLLIDSQGRVLPVETIVPKDKESFWNFVAASADRPITIFGEWVAREITFYSSGVGADKRFAKIGAHLTLISAWDQGRALLVDGASVRMKGDERCANRR